MEEIWKDIEGYEGLYQVNSQGRIYSVPRIVNKGQKVGGNYIVPVQKNKSGYFRVGLHKDGRLRLFVLSRLVAKAFPEICGEWFEGCQVHHKDHNPLNNRADNLVVLSEDEHSMLHYTSEDTYNYRSEAQKEAWKKRTNRICYKKAVNQYDISGNFIKSYSSLKEASIQTGTNIPAMSSCLNGRYKTAGGYKWRYATDRI